MTPARRPPPAVAPADAAGAELTAPVEDYLKTIYEIERESGAAATNDIAGRLSIAPASVSGMVRRLSEQGLLSHERYHGVRLTSAGRKAALRTLRRHRVIEAYLAQRLGYPWDRVHEEAERLEHAASEELIDRMASALGNPRVDPHGAPIPTREGAVDETAHHTIADLEPGAEARVVRVSDEDGAMLRYLATLGIVPGTDVRLIARAPFDGPLSVAVAGITHAVGPALAARITVEPRAGKSPRKTKP